MNATDTSFTAKRVHIKEQQLSTAQKIEATAADAPSAFYAVIRPTLSQTGHYNANTRKEAFLTLLKRCKEQSDITDVVNILLESVGRGMVDREAMVRSAVCSLTSFIFEQRVELRVLIGGWLQFLLLALTHLYDDIRKDSIKFLEVAMRHRPLLILPSTGKILAALADGCSKSKLGNAKSKARDVAFGLLKSYIGMMKSPEITSTIYYTWKPQQAVSLRHSLMRRTRPSGPVIIESILEGECSKSLTWLLQGILEDWLEVAPFTEHDLKVLDKASRTKCLRELKDLFLFTKFAGFDDELLIRLLPKPIRESHIIKQIM